MLHLELIAIAVLIGPEEATMERMLEHSKLYVKSEEEEWVSSITDELQALINRGFIEALPNRELGTVVYKATNSGRLAVGVLRELINLYSQKIIGVKYPKW